ncbi:O-antigen ligase family protein [Winogradskyella litoriviva]|uniref:O-antigen ligase family protein n=1 Tax=Winogradskyella litoriviva TaxID=1220182 RepID=A0ABX2E388_9FLAO|nr:O-antigen ligase family protein [Winogradskyella litoriviva]NRD22815.1 O-antigen ligase family protein [Winogradskyella litoriviva]
MIKDLNYLSLIVLHIVIGILIFYLPIIRQPFYLAVIVYFVAQIIIAKKSKKTLTVLFACSYIVAGESLFRMTGGGLFYEISKYLIILFSILGMFYSGISNRSYPYFFYLIALLPAVVLASINLGYDLIFRSSVAFVLSGPVALGISSLYCYNKRITKSELLDIIKYLSLPVISMTTYLFLYSPSIKETLAGTGSNFGASGGFGPNQVSTILGLGIFALTVRFFLKSPNLLLKIFNGSLIIAITFRALVTFSRGGVFTAILMIGAFLLLLFSNSSFNQKRRIIFAFILFCLFGLVTWVVSKDQTNGLIENRYANQDAVGRNKDDITTGRTDLFLGELEGFINHPYLGVGASGMKQVRLEKEGQIIASHNEISRLLSEHGILGIFIICILLLKPLSIREKSKNNLFFYAFLVFWFATINHSAMRLAAPGFIYALALLNVTNEKKRPIHRKRIIQ